MKWKVLVVDDDSTICRSIKRILEVGEYHVETADSGERGLEMLSAARYDLLLLDLRLGSMDGLEVLRQVKDNNPDQLVIMITGFANIASAVEAMKIGAYDYIQKPYSTDELKLAVQKAMQTVALRKEVEELRKRQMEKNKFDKIIGSSREINKVLSLVRTFAQTNITVLIEGESGTGKELVAEYLHYYSPRYAKPFIALNCGAVARNLIESELFGYEKGAFTGADRGGHIGFLERSDGGTLFLDEVAELSEEAQVKFLRVLEKGEFYPVGGTKLNQVDLRVIAASNTSLAEAVEEGRFRRDLYYRINVAHIELPPLRDRKTDIVQLAKFFMDRFSRKLGRKLGGFTKAAEEVLLSYAWPGNVRELRNLVERVALLCNNPIIDTSDLAYANLTTDLDDGMLINLTVDLKDGNNAIRKVDSQLIQKVLEITAGNKTRAARLLGIPRGTLRYHLDRDQQP
ncbi:two-component system response regulator [candidate division LCP-89 bacterium B3_LCP]|uniref:Two-component system response regulator n=1 Tax=candidate division LCP-89 bacterium B3_LCP TaxID=2012998 RepID=A0A532UXW6_UNCL8|nr:MAG: two-component system response regulator [candidate division LCP-89 bacterium B3_LCP]